jgi:hypothetical protein
MSILVLTSDTLIGTPATGNLEYNGQFFGTDSNASRAQIQRITSGTAVASTSGTSIDFTSLPSWIKRITVMLSAVSTNGAGNMRIQIGTGGTPTTSGYVCMSMNIATAGNAALSGTAGFDAFIGTASYSINGAIRIQNITGNTWVAEGTLGNVTTTSNLASVAGTVTLGGALNFLRFTTTTGTDTFDAGTVNIIYEG